MKTYIKIAWRNLWRNKRRTLITISSLFFAVIYALAMRSMQIGMYDQMIENVTELGTGHLQIHKKGYWEDRCLDSTFTNDHDLYDRIAELDNVEAVIPRFEHMAIIYNEKNLRSKPSMFMGIDPVQEDKLSRISDRIVEGEYLGENDDGLIIGERLAEFLEVDVGDTVIIITSDYYETPQYDLAPIKGIAHFPLPQLDKRLAMADIDKCMNLVALPDSSSAWLVKLDDPDDLEETRDQIAAMLPANMEVKTWIELNPQIVQQIESDDRGGLIMLYLLYLLIGFGVFGTIMMMTMERRKEFGVTIALGMQKVRLGIIVAIETIFIGVIGITSGALASIPIIAFLHHNPIHITKDELVKIYDSFNMDAVIPFALKSGFFLNQSIAVLIIIVIAIIYPVISIFRLKLIKALKSK